MPDVGINLTMQEQVSAVAPGVAGALRNIASMGEELRDSLDLSDLEEKYRQFAERMDRLYDAEKANRQRLREETQQYRQAQLVGRRAEDVIQTGTRVAQRAATTGDVTEAVPDVLGMIKKMIPGGPAGMVATAGVAAIAGFGILMNTVSKQYEKHMQEIVGLTASMGALGKTAEETSRNFGQVLEEVGDTASRFGIAMEQGINIFRSITEVAGTGRAPTMGAAEAVMAYSRGFGVPPNVMARYAGLGMRFNLGAPGQLLGMAAGGLLQSGMGRGQYNEFLQATLAIFEEGLSRGVVKGFEEINIMQTWLAQLGEAFTGQYGIQLYRQMNQAAAGAVALQSEQDVIMYRAAHRLLEKEAAKGGMAFTGSYIDVMKRLEGQMTPGLFTEVRGIIKEITGGNTADMIEMMRQTFRVSYTTAERLARARTSAEAIEALPSGWEPSMAGTPEMQLLEVQQTMLNKITEIGQEYILPIKAKVLTQADDIVSGLSKVLGVGKEGEAYQRTLQEEGRIKGSVDVLSLLVPQRQLRATGRGITVPFQRGQQFENVLAYQGAGAERPYYSEASAIIDLLMRAQSDERLREGLAGGRLTEILGRYGVTVEPAELKGILEDLKTAIQDLSAAARDSGNVEINMDSGASAVPAPYQGMIEMYKRRYGIK